jgi:predicted TPR repeat methyltransferase
LNHKEARQLGQNGKFDKAVASLLVTIELAPDWAYPVYDLAFTNLLKGDAEMAIIYYRQTDEMEPRDFFTTKTALYSLEGEQAGIFQKGLYLRYLQIEWTQDKREKFEIAKMITKKVPYYAPA